MDVCMGARVHPIPQTPTSTYAHLLSPFLFTPKNQHKNKQTNRSLVAFPLLCLIAIAVAIIVPDLWVRFYSPLSLFDWYMNVYIYALHRPPIHPTHPSYAHTPSTTNGTNH